MMKHRSRLPLIIFISTMMGLYMTEAHSGNKPDMTGMYTFSDVDSQTQLVLLADNTFCLTFVGGALDLLKAGNWTLLDSETIQLQEIRKTETIHPAIAKNIDRLGPLMVGINFDGYLLSHAYSPVFATSSTDALPTTFRPLFPDHTESWAMTYALPLMPAEQVKYFYIGDVVMGNRGPTKHLRVTQYKLDNFDAVRIGYNQIQTERPLQMKAHVTNTTVTLEDGTALSHKTELTSELEAEVRQVCFNPNGGDDEENGHVKNGTSRTPQHQELTPTKTFDLDASVIEGKPYFAIKDESNTTPTDSLEDLVESEKSRLQMTFEAVMADFKKVDDFLQLTQALANKKNRIGRHLASIMDHEAELLVKINVARNFKLAEKMFFHFAKYIYPVASKSKDSTVVYNISVMASQGLILTTMEKNPEIDKVIFNELLAQNFDITKHKNRTLIYNLACYYAVNNNKQSMLTAIAQAKLRGTPKKQFQDDADFKNYLSDPDFIKAIE